MKPGVRFVQTSITAIDPVAKRVETDAGAFDADVLVVALGADLDPAATPGLLEAGHEFYTVPGAFACRDVLHDFDGGRVIVAVTSTPFKCPPAPSETALLVHDFLVQRGLRDRSEIALVMPMGVPIPPSPAASKALLAAFEERGITWHPQQVVRGLDPATKVARMADGGEMPFDLFLGVPVHRVPEVVAQSGMAVDGWIPVDPRTLETSYPDVYAVGDVTSVGTPKAGVFAEGQAIVVADAIIAKARTEWRRFPLRRARHLLPGVRQRRGRQGRRDLHAGSAAHRRLPGPVRGLRRRQARVRVHPHPAVVRPHLVDDGLAAATPRCGR